MPQYHILHCRTKQYRWLMGDIWSSNLQRFVSDVVELNNRCLRIVVCEWVEDLVEARWRMHEHGFVREHGLTFHNELDICMFGLVQVTGICGNERRRVECSTQTWREKTWRVFHADMTKEDVKSVPRRHDERRRVECTTQTWAIKCFLAETSITFLAKLGKYKCTQKLHLLLFNNLPMA